jgi:N-acetyl-anhydromuramyl-L-alanine amidase AmpD
MFQAIKKWFSNLFKQPEHNAESQTRVETSKVETLKTPKAKDKEERITGLLFYPKAIQFNMPTFGSYRYGYPEGVVLHYTAGWDRHLQDAIATAEWAKTQGLCFDLVSVEGKVIQGAPLDRAGSHAGVSNWAGLGNRVSQYLRGIEVQCGGMVDEELKTYFGRKYTLDQVRVLKETTPHWGQAGRYVKVTDEQFNAVTEYIIWLYHNSPFKDGKRIFSLDYVLAHHEVSGVLGLGYWRKPDIGGSWPMPMNEYRHYLKSKIAT